MPKLVYTDYYNYDLSDAFVSAEVLSYPVVGETATTYTLKDPKYGRFVTDKEGYFLTAEEAQAEINESLKKTVEYYLAEIQRLQTELETIRNYLEAKENA